MKAPPTVLTPPPPPTARDRPRSPARRRPVDRQPPPLRSPDPAPPGALRWLHTGTEGIEAMVAAIENAREFVRFETYIYASDATGRRVREALRAACTRGVAVRVLVDAFGSGDLPDEFWEPLRTAGADCRWFNPPRKWNFGPRDHRKLLVCDQTVALVGGFNVADEYNGDGVTRGWRDLGLESRTQPLIGQLTASFDEFFARAGRRIMPLTKLRPSTVERVDVHLDGELLLSGPSLSPPTVKTELRRDIAGSEGDVLIISPYFLPTWRLRHALLKAARQGRRICLILPGKTDVPLSRLASQRLYRSLLRAGVEIYEYQPQILHAKLLVIGRAAYVGSANLDRRSLSINYELLVRLRDPATVAGARELFGNILRQSRRVDVEIWRRSRTVWSRLRERWAYLLLARVDPYLVRLRGGLP